MKTCDVCGWQRTRRRDGRCNACRLFRLRHGRDKTPAEVMAGFERVIDGVGRVLTPPPEVATCAACGEPIDWGDVRLDPSGRLHWACALRVLQAD